MPELPEVETVRRGLEPHLTGARIRDVDLRRPDLRFPFPDRFAERLEGARVEGLERRAKYLLSPLDTGETLIVHLGMTGRFLVGEAAAGEFAHPASLDEKHVHLRFATDGGTRLAYADARRFGYMTLAPSDGLSDHVFFRGLGPEPLGNGFHAEGLAAAFAGRRQAVKTALLDQRIVAGLGNIYACEALHRARIDPRRPAGELRPAETSDLVRAVREVLLEAIESGGSTLRDYRAADGALGYFQHRFRVYGREGEPCLREGCGGTVERIVQGARSTFFCATCQE